MNKKANIPVVILVVATIAVCIIALIAFHNKNEDEDNKLVFFKYLRAVYSINDNVAFHLQEGYIINSLTDLYPTLTLFVSLPNYRPVAEHMRKENGFYVFEKKDGNTLLVRFKVPIESD